MADHEERTAKNKCLEIILVAAALALVLTIVVLLSRMLYPTAEGSLVSGEGNEVVFETENTVMTKGGDPSLRLSFPIMRIRNVAVAIEEMQAPGNYAMMQLFYTDDAHPDLAEDRSCRIKGKTGTNLFVLPALTKVNSLRLDPAERADTRIVFGRIACNVHNGFLEIAGIAGSVLLLILAGWIVRNCSFKSRLAVYGTVAAEGLVSLSLLTEIPSAGTLLRVGGIAAFGTALLLSGIWCVTAGSSAKAERWYVLLLLVSCFALYTMLAYILPNGEGPDEPMRYQVVEYIRLYRKIPRGDDPLVVDPAWGFSYAFYPCLPYIIGGGFAKIAAKLTGNWHLVIFAARMVSVLSMTAFVFFVWRIAKKLFTGSLRYAIPALAAFFPGSVNIATYVSTEAFAVMGTAIVLLAWISGTEEQWRIRDCVLLSLGMAACILSYYNSYGVVLISIPLFIITVWKRNAAARGIGKTCFVTALTFALAGWWFIRNALIYDGDLFARRTLNATQAQFVSDEINARLLATPVHLGYTIPGMIKDLGWLRSSLKSFVSAFARGGLHFSSWIYAGFLITAVLSGIGLVILSVRTIAGKSADKGQIVLTAGMFFTAVFPIALSLWYSYTSDYQPQGRYWMPGAAAMLCIAGKGLENLRIKRRNPEETAAREESVTGWILMAFLICVSLSVYGKTILPYYIG